MLSPTGVVSLHKAPDHEKAAVLLFEVEVRWVKAGQGADANWQGARVFRIAVTDVNDTAPLFASGITATPVGEDVAPGTDEATRGGGHVVYIAGATPDVAGDDVAYSLSRNADDDSAMFGIDEKSGAVWFVTAPDHEVKTSYRFTVEARVGELSVARQVTIAVTDVDEAPTALSLTGLVEGGALAETAGSGRIALARITVTDPDTRNPEFRKHGFTLSDPARFEVVDGILYLKAGVVLDHETAPSHSVTVGIAGHDGLTQDFTLNVTDVNDTPLVWDALGSVSVAEGRTDTGLDVATAVKTDDAGGPVSYEIVGAAMRALFEIDAAGRLVFRQAPDFDDGDPNSYEVEIRATSLPVKAGGQTQSATQTVTVTVENRPDEALSVDAITDLTVEENTTRLTGTTRLDVTTDERGDLAGLVEYRLKDGAPHEYVEVLGDGTIRLKAAPDHEAAAALRFEVEARWVKAGQGDEENWQGARAVEIAVTDVNEAPTALSLDVIEGVNIAETAGSTRTALARLTVTDPDTRNPAFREHGFTLSDPARFEIEDGVLYLKAGVVLDHETAPSHSVTVGIAGHDHENNENLTQTFTLNVTVVDEAPTALSLDVIEGGALDETAGSTRTRVTTDQPSPIPTTRARSPRTNPSC